MDIPQLARQVDTLALSPGAGGLDLVWGLVNLHVFDVQKEWTEKGSGEQEKGMKDKIVENSRWKTS